MLLYGWCMLIGGNRLLGASFRLRWLTVGAVIVATALVGVSVAVPFAIAQDPPDDYVPEPGYLDGPGDFGYPRSDDEVAGEQSLCEDDPGAPQCPIPPPLSISRPTATFSATAANLSVAYQRVVWALQSSHYYMFELHRSRTASGTFTKSADDWDEETPVLFNGVSVGYYYKVRAKRCRVPERESTCGAWGKFSSTLYVPEVATGLDISRSITTLTATYRAPGTSYDEINTAERSIGSTGNGDSEDDDINGSGHSWSGSRGKEYRFQVRRCTQRDRTGCGGWSDWSDWEPVPDLPSAIGRPELERTITDLSVHYTASDHSYDKYDLEQALGTRGRWEPYLPDSDSSKLLGVPRNHSYRVKVTRCTDDALTDCIGASDWSYRLFVPNLPDDPGALTLKRSITNLSVSYEATDSSYDKYDIQRAGATRGSFRDYRAGTANRFKLVGVPRNYRYHVRVYRCTDDELLDCRGVSDWSSELLVPNLPDDPGEVELERSITDLSVSYDATDTSYDKYDLQRAGATRGSFRNYRTDTDNSLKLVRVPRAYRYRVKVTRCTDDALTDCIGRSGWSNEELVPVLPGKPAKPTLTVSEDDLTVVYTAVTGTYPKFNFASNETKSGRYDAYAGGALVGAKLSSVATGKWYKVTLQLCTDDGLTDCSVESEESAAAGVPHGKPGTPSLTVSEDDLTVVYTVVAGTHDEFDFESSPSSGGTYKGYSGGTLSGTKRSDVARGAWYKVRVRRCLDAQHTVCSEWSEYSSGVVVLPKTPGKPTLTVSEDDLTVSYTVDDGFTSKDDYEFTTNDTESGNYTAYTGGTLSGAKRTGVATGMWYKVRVRRCLETTHVNCSAWSVYSDAKEVPEPSRFPALAKPTIESRADGVSVLASFTLVSGYDYELELQSSGNQKDYVHASSVKLAATRTSHTFTGLSVVSGRSFQARVRACVTGSTTDCGDWLPGNVITLSKAPAPTVTGITVANEDDLTIAYTLPAWQHGTGKVYDFKIRRADTSSGPFTSDYADATTPSGQPHKFNNVHTGYYYRALARRCSDTAKSICGDWSGVQSGVNVPALSAVPPPTNIVVTAVSQTAMKASFTDSDWPRHRTFHYVFDLSKSDTRNGTYVYSTSTTSHRNDEVSFTGVEPHKWYKVRGKRCHTGWKRCGAWEVSAVGKRTVLPDPEVEIAEFGSSIAIGAGLSHNLIVTANGLDVREAHTIVYTSTKSGPRADVLRFSKCGQSEPEAVEFSVIVGRSSSGPVPRRLYACAPGTDSLLVSVRQGSSTIALASITVNVNALLVPTNLQVSGDSRSSTNDGRALFQFNHADRSGRSTTFEARFAIALHDDGSLVSESVQPWSDPIPLKGLHGTYPYIDPLTLEQLYWVQIRAARGGVTTDWSDIEFVYPTKDQPVPVDMNSFTSAAWINLWGYINSHTYRYVICEETFPETNRNAWISAIDSGISQWSLSLPWRTASSIPIIGHQRLDPTEEQCKPFLAERRPRGEIHYMEDQDLYFEVCRDVQKISLACAFHPDWKIDGQEGVQDGFMAFRHKSAWDLAGHCSEVFRLAMHESGHVYGLHHSGRFIDAVMFRELRPFCEPQLRDKAAMMALYQSHER